MKICNVCFVCLYTTIARNSRDEHVGRHQDRTIRGTDIVGELGCHSKFRANRVSNMLRYIWSTRRCNSKGLFTHVLQVEPFNLHIPALITV